MCALWRRSRSLTVKTQVHPRAAARLGRPARRGRGRQSPWNRPFQRRFSLKEVARRAHWRRDRRSSGSTSRQPTSSSATPTAEAPSRGDDGSKTEGGANIMNTGSSVCSPGCSARRPPTAPARPDRRDRRRHRRRAALLLNDVPHAQIRHALENAVRPRTSARGARRRAAPARGGAPARAPRRTRRCAFGLPGKLTISVRPRVPATPRESIQCSVCGAGGGAHRLGDPRRLALDHLAGRLRGDVVGREAGAAAGQDEVDAALVAPVAQAARRSATARRGRPPGRRPRGRARGELGQRRRRSRPRPRRAASRWRR